MAVATRARPDVILMDIRLPDMDGIDVARLLKDDPRTARIPVLAVTSLVLPRDGDWLRDSGFEVTDMLELRPPEGATTRYEWMSLEWARQWPSEEVWKARRR